jgi:hypothetical protein
MLIFVINEAVGVESNGAWHKSSYSTLAQGDLVGNDVWLVIMEVLYTKFDDSKYKSYP